MATTGLFFLFFFPFFSQWQNNLRPSAELLMCSLALRFQSEEKRWMVEMSGRRGREGRMPWKHGFYHSFKFYTTTPGSFCAADWRISALLQIAFCVVLESVSSPQLCPRADLKRSLRAEWKHLQPTYIGAVFPHTRCRVLSTRAPVVPRTAPFFKSCSYDILHGRTVADGASFPLMRQFLIYIQDQNVKCLNTLGDVLYCRVVWPCVAVQCTTGGYTISSTHKKPALLVFALNRGRNKRTRS